MCVLISRVSFGEAAYQSATGTAGIDPKQLDAIIQRAIRSALDEAYHNWNTGIPPAYVPTNQYIPSNPTVDSAGIDKLTQIVARLDVLQDRLQTVEASSAISVGDKTALEAVHVKLNDLNNRLVMLENTVSNLRSHNGRNLDDSRADNMGVGGTSALMRDYEVAIEKKLRSLSERLLTLEAAVESEHETSLQVLDVLLNQKQSPSPAIALGNANSINPLLRKI